MIAIDEKPKRGGTLTRVRNIQRDERVSLLVDHYEEDWSRLAWVRVDGHARVVERGEERPDGLAALREKYEQYRAMGLESRQVIVIAPGRVIGWRATGDDFGGGR